MLFYIILFTAVAILISVLYLRSMRPVDVVYYVMIFISRSGLIGFLVKTGLNKKMRPKSTELVAPNGVRFMAPSAIHGIILEPTLKLKVRKDDVFIATYPKAGTTWVQEITWLICNNADTEAAKTSPLTARSPFIETIDISTEIKGLQSIESWPINSRRIIKTHLPYELLPEELSKESGKNCKIIYVARNPNDLCVSYYFFHHLNVTMESSGTWNNFLDKFCSGGVSWGSWFSHTLKFWKESQEDKRIHFTTYEKMKKDLRGEVVSLSKFLSVDLTDEQIDSITTHCYFSNMRNNITTNYTHTAKYGWDFDNYKFMRKGEVGDWKNYFTLNQNIAFDELYEEKLKNTGLKLLFELD
uniref:sulfotransferase family cytosolic 1B member 1-like isoform X1 n=1 Tax=Styela clava TaxID=7725 RepID=UPI0019398CE7|nr:sulfotransferase family cytosolic 1B member 1-like isoform X1 [Styela clava]